MSSKQDSDGQQLGLPDPDADPAYQRIRAAIAESGGDHVPKAGWDVRVWAAIDADASAPGVRETAPRWRGLMIAGGLALVAAAVLLTIRPWQGDAPASRSAQPDVGDVRVAARLERIPGAERVRSESYAVGDRVRIDFPAADGAVWIYRGEHRLVLACTTQAMRGPACQPSGPGVVAVVALDAPGTYTVISAVGAGDAPATVDEALASLARAGIRAQQDRVEVY